MVSKTIELQHFRISLFVKIMPIIYHHYQPINVATAGAKAFLMDYT
jgi:hypothetical protein